MNYGKIRASWAKVGSDADPYNLNLIYNLSNRPYTGFPVGYINNNLRPNPDLRPTMTTSTEYGIETKYFNNRLTLDVTYYSQVSSNQIMNLPTSATTGYSNTLINAGKILNRGVEVVVNSRPVVRGDFAWDLNLNFARNKNTILELFNDGHTNIPTVELAPSPWCVMSNVQAVVGEKFAAIKGQDFKRSPSGEVIIGENGFPLFGGSDWITYGYGTWDWTGGMYNRFGYKNFSIHAIIDIKAGADMFSMTDQSNFRWGRSIHTLEGRDGWYASEEKRIAAGKLPSEWTATGGYLAKGVIEKTDENGNKTYVPNDIYVNPETYWDWITLQMPGQFVYDNSYSKIREIVISYNLPKRWISSFADELSFSVIARNPFIIFKNVPNIDPESTYNNSFAHGLEYGSLPSRKSFGFNLFMKF